MAAAVCTEPCSRCRELHWAKECEYRLGGTKAGAPCPACGRTGHAEPACWRAHPELRPAELGGQAGVRRTFAAIGEGAHDDGGEKGQLYAMVEDLQTQLQLALSASMHSEATDDLPAEVDEEYDLPCYTAAVAEAAKTAGRVEYRNAPTHAKLPRSFQQLPVGSGGERELQRHTPDELQAGKLASKVTSAPCLSMEDLGLNTAALKAAFLEWIVKRRGQQVHGQRPEVESIQAAVTQEVTAARPHEERMKHRGGVAMVDNHAQQVELNGWAPERVLIDTGAEPVLLGRRVQQALGLCGAKLELSSVNIATSAGTKERVVGVTKAPIKITSNPRRAGECSVYVKCLVSEAENYDVLLGSDATYWPGLSVDTYTEQAYYRPAWRSGDYSGVAFLPSNLHGAGSWRSRESLMACAATHLGESDHKVNELLSYETCLAREIAVREGWPPRVAYDPEGFAQAGKIHTLGRDAMVTPTDPAMKVCQTPVCLQPSAEGVVVLELFAGMAAGLEAVLRTGIKVRKYYYCDRDDDTRKMARHRLDELRTEFPDLLMEQAVQACQSTFPQDVRHIGEEQLQMLGVDIDVLIAGWSCQGMSWAGAGEGLEHAETACVRI